MPSGIEARSAACSTGLDLDHGRCRNGCDGQQADAFKRRQRRVGGLAACSGFAAAGEVAGCRRGGEHGSWNAVPSSNAARARSDWIDLAGAS